MSGGNDPRRLFSSISRRAFSSTIFIPFVNQIAEDRDYPINSLVSNSSSGNNANVVARASFIPAVNDGHFYASVADVETANVRDALNYLVTAGYYTPGDGGSALYVKVDSQPRWLGGQIRSADGVWFALAEPEPNVRMFGAKGDGFTDDTAAIQNCIDYVMYRPNPLGTVKVSPGKYKTSDTIHLGYGDTFKSVVFEGDIYRYAGGSTFCGAVIIPTFSDRPCINIQGGRGTTIRGLSLIGLNKEWIESKNLGGLVPSIPDLLPHDWISPSLHTNAGSRYAPYSAITIDAYSGPAPSPAYPKVSYPPYLNMSAQYNKSYSSNTLIENCEIEGFVVGVAIQPCDADGNGDYTKLHRIQISHCQYALSIGNGQSRLVHIADSVFALIHTGIVTTVHGRQIGKPSILVTSSEIGTCIRWISIPNLSYGGGPRFVDCYGEVIYSLGNVGTNAVGEHPIVFGNCEFNFESQSSRGCPAWVLDVNGPTLVRFEGCAFKGATGRFAFGPAPARHFSFVNCVVDTRATIGKFGKFALNATCGITFGQLATNPIEFSVSPMATWNLDTGTPVEQTVFTKSNGGVRSQGLCVYSTKAQAASSPNDPGADVSLAGGLTLRKIALSFAVYGRDVTFDGGLQSWEFAQYGFDVGDIVYDDHTHVTYYVRSRTGSIITMRAETGFDGSGNLLLAMTKTGNLFSLNCKCYTPQFVLYGTTTAGKAVLENAARDDRGGSTWIENDIAVGDWFFVRGDIDSFTAPNLAQIRGRDGTTNVITIVGPFNRSEMRKRFAVFIRAPAPNE